MVHSIQDLNMLDNHIQYFLQNNPKKDYFYIHTILLALSYDTWLRGERLLELRNDEYDYSLSIVDGLFDMIPGFVYIIRPLDCYVKYNVYQCNGILRSNHIGSNQFIYIPDHHDNDTRYEIKFQNNCSNRILVFCIVKK